MPKKPIIFILLSMTTFVACSITEDMNSEMLNAANKLPGVYKVEVKQGNKISQEMVDQLRPGMDKRQVRFLLGTPLLMDSFHKNRWEYLYTLKKQGKLTKQEKLTVIFKDDKLAGVTGHFKPSNEFKPMTINTEVIDIPRRKEKEPGMIENILHSIGIEYTEE